ncbi:glutathione S-transferase [Trametes maxima]|nr:glutathione S-transferase [Trametes maxima]
MSQGYHFTLYTTVIGPNGWKVAIVLEELGLSYKSLYLDFSKNEQKSPEHLKYNPNGRIPTLIDHENNDFAIWESNAIILYLVDKYDTEHKFSVENFEERAQLLQWLFFQASGQGPYFGQAAHFVRYHPERIPSATERYQKEVLRVLGVLDGVLSKREWLVGNKLTVADISFITWVATYAHYYPFNRGVFFFRWNVSATTVLLKDYHGFDLEKDFPSVYKWHTKLLKREATSKVYNTLHALIKSGSAQK